MDNQVKNVTRKPVQKHRLQNRMLYGIASLLIIGVFVLSLVLWPKSNEANPDRIQVVVLSSGQTYFGKLKNTEGTFLTLENVYYSKADELPADATEEQRAATASNSTLVKMGSEVYGPENTLKLRADQVIFWQNLREDSKVAKAILSAK